MRLSVDIMQNHLALVYVKNIIRMLNVWNQEMVSGTTDFIWFYCFFQTFDVRQRLKDIMICKFSSYVYRLTKKDLLNEAFYCLVGSRI